MRPICNDLITSKREMRIVVTYYIKKRGGKGGTSVSLISWMCRVMSFCFVLLLFLIADVSVIRIVCVQYVADGTEREGAKAVG